VIGHPSGAVRRTVNVNPPVQPTVLSSRGDLRLFRPDHPLLALGLAVSHLMTKPAFADLRFGEWSRILVGQIRRGHYAFAVDSEGTVQGFVGWALATKDHAEAWLHGRARLSYEDSGAGDCVVFNAWSANSSRAHRFLLDEVRRLFGGMDTIYFKRRYKDGRLRPVRLTVNRFVAGHARKTGSRPTERA
jgi:hemolysin-activating ACP:hemolysin acyltransferase